ncbi:MAG: V-type ATP synthase subunit E [Eubacteriales bacterium]|jgi:V/A-type H+-transporting ATPase subunit E
MTGLEKITSRIIADAESDARATLAEAEKKRSAVLAEYAARANEIRERLLSEAERGVAEIMSRAESAAAMQARNILLTEKSRLLDAAFDGARSRILSMPDGEYLEFLSGLLFSAMLEQLETERVNRELYGEVDLPVVDSYEVILNAKDHQRCGNDLVARVRELLRDKADPGVAEKLMLSADTADIEGGLILRYGDVSINCSLSVLIDSIRNSVEAEVYKVLFDTDQVS